jgi:hypothetical protein
MNQMTNRNIALPCEDQIWLADLSIYPTLFPSNPQPARNAPQRRATTPLVLFKISIRRHIQTSSKPQSPKEENMENQSILRHYGYKPIGQPSRLELSPFHILSSFPRSWYHMHQPPRNTVRPVSREVVQRAPRAHPLGNRSARRY